MAAGLSRWPGRVSATPSRTDVQGRRGRRELFHQPIAYQDMSEEDFRSAAAEAGVPEMFATVSSDTDAGVAKRALYEDGGKLAHFNRRPTTPSETQLLASSRRRRQYTKTQATFTTKLIKATLTLLRGIPAQPVSGPFCVWRPDGPTNSLGCGSCYGVLWPRSIGRAP
ncbi:hypothetical protein PMI07_006394 [Rhizobium sp. CF080]|nr:hypothetical protein PMI07_006394 [Rhizobium sp. CF080]